MPRRKHQPSRWGPDFFQHLYQSYRMGLNIPYFVHLYQPFIAEVRSRCQMLPLPGVLQEYLMLFVPWEYQSKDSFDHRKMNDAHR